ncbi:MAG: PKD domain-containing protein [Bacteroidia bacterium]
MKRIALLLLTLLIAVFSCKKKTLPETAITNVPVFYFKGDVNNVTMSINAGISNYYMYSSYTQNTNGLYSFMGNLKQHTTANNSIQVQINDTKISAIGGASYATNTLQVGSYNYIDTTTVSGAPYNVQFTASTINSASVYNWDFGDGTTTNTPNPIHTYATMGEYNVCLTVTTDSTCYSQLCNVQKIGYGGNKIKANITSTAQPASPTITFNTTIISGTAPFNYNWDFGDSSYSAVPNPTHTYNDSGIYNVILRLDNATDTTIVNYTAKVGITNACDANYTATIIPNIKPFANIIITYTDGNGVVYTSNASKQPANSSFKITAIDSYDNNERNELVKKLKINFNCTLYNATNSIQINNGEATIAVSYK